MYPGHWARVSPERSAAVNADTGETLSYAELDARSNRLAHFLARSGLRRGDHIALLMDDLDGWVDTFKGAVKSGSKRRADQAQDFIVSILKSAKEAMK